jgi:hypothetical protein
VSNVSIPVDSVARHLKLNVIKADIMSETDLGDKRFDINIRFMFWNISRFTESDEQDNQLLSPGGLS